MAPIPVYSASPINASKASGISPPTAQPKPSERQPSSVHSSKTGVEASHYAYPPAQPGAAPSLPVPTATTSAPVDYATAPPTRTIAAGAYGPPPPQPGAVPIAPGGSGVTRNLPPPPKAGESLQQQQQGPLTTGPVNTMPHQMGYPAPQPSFPIQGRSSTTTTGAQNMMSTPAAGVGGPSFVDGSHLAAGYSPPAGGYQQDINAASYNNYQRSAASYDAQEGDASVWDTAKKWAASAGDSLAAAENEVWKRINKD